MAEGVKALVTGGAGFIGSHLVDRLLADGYRVAVIDNLRGGHLQNLNKDATFYQTDITTGHRGYFQPGAAGAGLSPGGANQRGPVHAKPGG